MNVLIVSPHFPPTNAPDHQRVRLLLPYLQEHDWQAEVLAVDAGCVASPVDEWLVAGLPAEVPVHRVRALGLGWSRIPGLGTLTFRALRGLRREGDALLKSGRFDLVYFSTTQFGVHLLGPRWKEKFGVPFVMDYQDPWVSDYYRAHPKILPPGGRLKYWIVDWLNRRQEPPVLRHCSGITSVSAAYPRQLEHRYPWLKVENWEGGEKKPESERQTQIAASSVSSTAVSFYRTSTSLEVVEQKADSGLRKEQGRSPNSEVQRPILTTILPFPGDEADLKRVAEDGTRQNSFTPNDGHRHWVYVGRGGPDMRLALSALFLALSKYLQIQPRLRQNLRLHFIGTSYAKAGRGQKIVEPLAKEYGLADLVTESTDRIPYSETLRCLLDADALIVPGSDDPGYTASKIYPYILAKKPLLAIFHAKSSVTEILKKTKAGTIVSFQSEDAPQAIAARILETNWLRHPETPATVWSEFEPFTAREMTRRLCRVFDLCVSQQNRECQTA